MKLFAGSYKKTSGTALCSACSSGYYNLQDGAVSCIQCPIGNYCPVSVLNFHALCGCFFKLCNI